jgi:glycosyltransferase involved in cell wall biosynthesis
MVYELYHPVEGGVQTWISEVAPRLATHHDITLLTTALRGDEPLVDSRVGLCRVGMNGILPSLHRRNQLSLFRSLWAARGAVWIRKHAAKYDLIYGHVQASELAGVLGAYPLRPVIWHYHGTNHEVLYELFGRKKALLYELFEHIGAKLPFDYCVTSDHYTEQIMLHHFGVNPERISTIWNGVDINKFRPLRSDPVKGLVVSARRLVYKNGIQFLISAMKTVLTNQPRAMLWIAGEGPMKTELMELVELLGLGKSVRFLGQISNKDMPELYNKAEVVVLPSIIEATAIGCLEAMACAKPVIATAVGGIPEVINEGAGFLVKYRQNPSFVDELAQIISLVLTNRQLARLVGEAARERATSLFTWDKTAKALDNLISHRYQQ